MHYPLKLTIFLQAKLYPSKMGGGGAKFAISNNLLSAKAAAAY